MLHIYLQVLEGCRNESMTQMVESLKPETMKDSQLINQRTNKSKIIKKNH